MRLTYHRIMRYIKESLWYTWHVRLRNVFGDYSYDDSRPWWHLCCNGNAGGWRTKFCDSLEDYNTGWRYHDAIINDIKYGEIK